MTTALLALIILAAEPAVQTDRTAAAADDVFACDFEDQADKNYDAWPDDWTRRRGRGYPAYLPIGIVKDDHTTESLNRCLRIQLDGGAAQLYCPTIAVVPQFSYQLTAKIRTRGLKHDVVSVSVGFYDGEDNLVEIHESQPIFEAEDWTAISIGPVTPPGDRVRTAIISVHLRPTEQADLVGEVYLDDLWLGRLPKLSLEVDGENGIFSDPKAVRVNCRVSGLKSATPEIKFELLDVDGACLAEEIVHMDIESESARVRAARVQSAGQPGLAGGATWHPQVDRPGFYTVRVSTPGQSGIAMRGEVNFVLLPSLGRRPSGEFGWSLAQPNLPVPTRSLPSLLNQVGVHWVKFPVWFSAKEEQRAEEIARFADRLSSFDIKMVGLLDHPPAEVRAVFGASEQMPIATAFADKAVWLPALDPVLTRLSLKVRWWQIGRDDDTSFSSFPDVPERLQDIRTELSKFGQRVNVGIPWQALEEHPLPDRLTWAFLSCNEDLPFTDDELAVYLAGKEGDNITRWMMLQPLSARDYDLKTRACDLVRRMLAAKIAGANAIFIPHPFDADRGLMKPDGSPGPLLLAWRTTVMLVGGGTYAGSINLPEGSENHLFVYEDKAVMVIWNDHPVTETIFLGEEAKPYDLWGCAIQPDSETSLSNNCSLQVGPMPIFITGVNPFLAKWRRDFEFVTERLASVFGREQSVHYQFTNTFPHGVGGRIKFQVPDNWKVESAERQFKLAPGETLKDTLRVSLGADAPSGPQPIRIDFELSADQSYQYSLYETIQVGLGDIQVQLETRLHENGSLIVEQHLINNTDKPVNFRCLLAAPGRRRERQQVINHGRGRTTNIYELPNGEELIGKMIWLRAEEIGGARVLNDQLIAHE